MTIQSATQKNHELIYSGSDGSQIFEIRNRAAAFVPKLKSRLAITSEFRGGNYTVDFVYTSRRLNYYSVYNFDQNFNSHISYVEKQLLANLITDLHAAIKINRIVSISLNINDIFDRQPIRQFGGLYDRDYPSLAEALTANFFSNFIKNLLFFSIVRIYSAYKILPYT